MNEKRDEGRDGVAKGERIARALARAGVGSRREVERMIAAGRVRVGGRRLDGPAFNVTSLKDVTVDGRPVETLEPTRLWRFHKPRGCLVTRADPQGRTTVFDLLGDRLPRVVTVGRLDLNSEGLLLLTNDGALARWLELPRTGMARRYRVRVFGRLDEARLDRLRTGIVIAGERFAPMDVEIEQRGPRNHWLLVTLREGRNREIRRAFAAIDLTVNRLIRIAYGPFALGRLPRGEVAEVPRKDLVLALADYFADHPPLLEEERALRRDPKKWARAKPRPRKPGRRPHRRRAGAKTGADGGREG